MGATANDVSFDISGVTIDRGNAGTLFARVNF
jgi:hypothetical protein